MAKSKWGCLVTHWHIEKRKESRNPPLPVFGIPGCLLVDHKISGQYVKAQALGTQKQIVYSIYEPMSMYSEHIKYRGMHKVKAAVTCQCHSGLVPLKSAWNSDCFHTLQMCSLGRAKVHGKNQRSLRPNPAALERSIGSRASSAALVRSPVSFKRLSKVMITLKISSLYAQ